ncbi:PhzF family phenazine biosynthesis protein [Planomicrobium sp. CPCC 101079]|uniref:PhzF family phenazine biosynthesis protein n=1 Tax=Planomicrobium sp. CPCC 101079 TaxID=2599618 RepID=UPI0011B65583|nr:PhzF family phenazine biosynthesis protein [Planomicrobium sp. CPCC 101079]TWT14545.1 PhzF family phenazine biosynthesis protein [Planomicrobium sp. CPCC 101079]
MKVLNYSLLDVFTTVPFGGNQLAVFHEGESLTTGMMQKIAKELNLSETVFLSPPNDRDNQKKLRIFTPQMELPMAGHPTIGAAFLLADQDLIQTEEGVNEWVLEEAVGDISVTVYKEGGLVKKVEMTQPLPSFGEQFFDVEQIAELLTLTPADLHASFPIQTVSTGVPFLFVPVRSLAAINTINFRSDVWEQHFSRNEATRHLFVFTTETEHPASTVHSRMFAPAMGIPEDPATGAASGPLGAYLVEHAVIPPVDNGIYTIRSEQGLEMGRPSFIDITIVKTDQGFQQVKIGGTSVTVGKGQLYLEDATR